MASETTTLLLVGALGAGIGVGKLLVTAAPLKAPLVLGHALTTAGIALGGLAFLTMFPGLSFVAQVGISCAIASVGTAGLQSMLERAFNLKSTTTDTK